MRLWILNLKSTLLMMMPWYKRRLDEYKRMRLGDRVSRSDTKIVGDRSVTFWHQDSKINEYWGDLSVTFRHQDSKESESWIMLIYSGLKKLFPKWVWCGGLSPHRCAWCYDQWLWYFLFSPVKYLVCFMLFDIYCFLFWVGQWYLLSTCALYWPLLVIFLFVICGVQ